MLQKWIPVELKLTASLFVNSLVTLGIAVVPVVVKDQKLCYYVTLFLMIIQGCAIAFLQSVLYGIAGISMILTNRLMVGIGIGSVSMNLLRMLFLWLVNSKQTG